MKKIISVFLVFLICLTAAGIYAEENEILELENLNDNVEILEQLESETFEIEEIPELPNDEDVTLYAAASIIDSGDCGESGNNLTWELDSNGVLTISGNGNLANYQSDSDVPWNEYAEQIKRVNLDMETISLCGNSSNYAFRMLTKVSEIRIPEGVTEIPQSPYLLPPTLRRLVLPSTYIGELSNNNLIRFMCYLDIEVAKDNPVYSSADGTLFSKDKTKLIQYTRSAIEPNYVIPETVTDIDRAFFGNSALQTLTITKNVEIVDRDTYNNELWNWGLGVTASASRCRAVYVEEENPYFCAVDGVLYNKDMSMLIWCPPHKTGARFDIPATVKIIAAGAFKNSRYSNIQIANGVEVLGSSAFSVSNITSITIPKSVKTIYSACFFWCNSLSKVYIEAEDNVSCAHQIFDACANLKTAGAMGSGCDIEFCWTTAIPAHIFAYCESLTEVTIPNTITSIGLSAFYECTGLSEIIIPESVITIGHSAFYKCTSLTEMTIPHSVTCIDDYAFEECTALTDMYIDKANGTLAGILWYAPNATVTYLREINIAPFPKSYMYTGSAITPQVSISERRKDGTASNTLEEHEDYTLNYADNINAGTANIEIDFQNRYSELKNKNLTFAITPKASNGLVIAPIPNQAYTSKAIMPNPHITDRER